MKKRIVAATLLALGVQQVYAQSSVTLYGLIDDGVNYINNVQTAGKSAHGKASLVFLSSGVLQGDRWGLRAIEDLGGGLQAIGVLESGWDLNTGAMQQGGAQFGRQAFIGLGSSVGTVTLGRQYDLLLDFISPTTSALWGGSYVAHISDIDNLNNTYRVNNALKFKSQPVGGVTIGAMYSLGGVAGDVTRNQLFGGGASYAFGSLYVGIGYMNARDPNVSVYGGNPSGGGAKVNNIGATTLAGVQGNPAVSGYASAHSKGILAIGGTYTIGTGKIIANYSNVRFKGLGDVSAGPNPLGYGGSATLNTAEVGYYQYVTPTLLLGGGYVFTKANNAGGNLAKYHQGQIGADYFLSKRTDLYATLVFQKASGTDSTGQQAVASINGVTPSSSDCQMLVRLGIRHKF
ncbi:porin [Burkholderia sp. GS2Y]|uniref:Porin n=1 Tax=Burkholderia theae TaxID=3143496 RepID=A0ABU9WRY8_9BURK